MTVSHRVVLLLALLLRIAGGLRRRPLRRALRVTRGSGADADGEPRPQALRALTVPRGGNDDENDDDRSKYKVPQRERRNLNFFLSSSFRVSKKNKP